MPLDGAWNAYIFREGKTSLSGPGLLSEFISRLETISGADPQRQRNALLDLLIRAGELECALADYGSGQERLVASITDQIAAALLGRRPLRTREIARQGRLLHLPGEIHVTPPEGFAYYSLHPMDFADLAGCVEIDSTDVAVIGIRSIGTTLSAVVRAAFCALGSHAERTTVRPTGHPYDRHSEFTDEQLRWIAGMLSRQANFLVVDEGPGMSGSSFLSVGDALVSAGVPRSRISFLGSRDPQPDSLTAKNAAQRWLSYRSYCTLPTRYLPRGAERFIAGGIWRGDVYPDQSQWPASWLQMERLKFTSRAEDLFFKFEGYGRFGETVHQRSLAVAAAGFAPLPSGFEEGFGVYPMVRGKICGKNDASAIVLQRLAEYCAFRTRALATTAPVNRNLEEMLRFNVREEFGVDLPAQHWELSVTMPVIADGRMLPHKWIHSDGTLLKVDNAIHGDDHFFPGPTDIAWDLAGVIVEWELGPDAAQFLLDRYFHLTADDSRPRISNYLLAYSVFRTAFCKMAAASMQGAEEEARLVAAYLRYRARAQAYLQEREGSDSRSYALGWSRPELRIA